MWSELTFPLRVMKSLKKYTPKATHGSQSLTENQERQIDFRSHFDYIFERSSTTTTKRTR
jgi:hypothetical protein